MKNEEAIRIVRDKFGSAVPVSIEQILLISIAMIDGRKALLTPGRYRSRAVEPLPSGRGVRHGHGTQQHLLQQTAEGGTGEDCENKGHFHCRIDTTHSGRIFGEPREENAVSKSPPNPAINWIRWLNKIQPQGD
jgi:hypothetical protein